MTFSTLAVGSYTAQYNPDTAIAAAAEKGSGIQSLGIVESVFLWQRRYQGKKIQSNLQANFVIDAIYQGGECFCRFTLKQWTPSIQAMLWPMAASFDEIGQTGALLSHYAGELILTADADTTAADNGPAIIRFGKALVAEDQPQEIPLGEVERDIQLVFRCFPYETALGKQVWFETT